MAPGGSQPWREAPDRRRLWSEDPLADPAWGRVLAAAGIGPATARWLSRLARRNGTSLHAELMASATVDREAYFRAIAAEIGVGFVEQLDADRLILRERDVVASLAVPGGPRLVQNCRPGAEVQVLLSPAGFDMPAMKAYLERYPAIAGRIAIVAPEVLRQALLRRARPALDMAARDDLRRRYPTLSAAIVASGSQGVAFGLAAAALLTALILAPGPAWLVLHAVFSLFFLTCIALRLFAAIGVRPLATPVTIPLPEIAGRLPVYSVLVPLYREEAMAPQLVAALERLDWPASKLEIKLICEEDDSATIDALRAIVLPANCEVLVVPPGMPRTKPKALSFALPVITGAFVCVYDAEDIPHPSQLFEAWRAFDAGGAELACVQAPLRVVNGDAGFLARMFAFEYSVLFEAILPALARRGIFLPLGGTSNHFRTALLRAAGGWDPFNVTEDADLAVRLCRKGYRIGTIDAPTEEDAPDTLADWLPQRTRWIKGWMQTLLVHWRSPGDMLRQMGPLSWTAAQIVLTGTVLSSLLYGLIAVHATMLVLTFLALSDLGAIERLLLALDGFNIVFALGAHFLLGWRLRDRLGGLPRLAATILRLPPYWLLISIAAWRALGQILHRPFLWEKTRHRPSGGAAMRADRWS